MQHKIMLVDGMALLFRGFFATSFRGYYMENSQGTPTNGVYQFLRYFLDAVETFKPTHVICCWDMGSKTFRTEKYVHYKANREAPPEQLIPQFDLVKEVVELFNIPNIGLENYEADDCIGTLAKQFAPTNEVFILTGDQDILQLVDDGIHVAIMRKGVGNYELFSIDNFDGKLGIQPKQIIDMKGLMGDPSDNYPGVKGIGEKTALKLLKEHGSIDNLLENQHLLTKGLQKKIEADIEMLFLSRELAEIKCDVPISCTIDEAQWRYNRSDLETQFKDRFLDNLIKTLI